MEEHTVTPARPPHMVGFGENTQMRVGQDVKAQLPVMLEDLAVLPDVGEDGGGQRAGARRRQAPLAQGLEQLCRVRVWEGG
jgi:hypothetical protein